MDERRRIGQLSRGTRQILGLKVLLAENDADLLLLDEPWEGLDPEGSAWLTDTVRRWRAGGAAILISSHRLYDLDSVCTRFLLLEEWTLPGGDGSRVAAARRSAGAGRQIAGTGMIAVLLAFVCRLSARSPTRTSRRRSFASPCTTGSTTRRRGPPLAEVEQQGRRVVLRAAGRAAGESCCSSVPTARICSTVRSGGRTRTAHRVLDGRWRRTIRVASPEPIPGAALEWLPAESWHGRASGRGVSGRSDRLWACWGVAADEPASLSIAHGTESGGRSWLRRRARTCDPRNGGVCSSWPTPQATPPD